MFIEDTLIISSLETSDCSNIAFRVTAVQFSLLDSILTADDEVNDRVSIPRAEPRMPLILF